MAKFVENKISIKYGEFSKEQIEKIREKYCVKEKTPLSGDYEILKFDFSKFVKEPENMIKVGFGENTVEAYSAFFKYNPLNLNKNQMKRALTESSSNKNNKDTVFKIIDFDGEEIFIDVWINKWFNETKPEISKDDYLPIWLDWNVENWGPKWNSYGETSVEPSGIYFETANGTLNDKILFSIVEEFKNILTPVQVESLQYAWKFYEEDDYLYYGYEIGRKYVNEIEEMDLNEMEEE